MTIDHQERIDFTDIANRPSAVHCNAPPRKMLSDVRAQWSVETETEVKSGNLLVKSVIDGDLEAFVKIADLYKILPEPAQIDPSVLESILTLDRAEILDEYIRRTGHGVDLSVAHKDDAGGEQPSNDKYKIYLGLSVHGKKRSDLAKKNDPNAAENENPFVVPMLWKAAQARAHHIVDYLCGDRPLVAYRFYCSANSDERAEQLRCTPNLDQRLPELLGWSTNALNESPLTAAILGNSLDILKKLFKHAPHILGSELHKQCVVLT